MEHYKIEKGIPVIGDSRYKKTMNLLSVMEIGDSFSFEGRAEQKYIVSLFSRMKQKGKYFRSTLYKDKTGRVWRVEPTK